MKKVIVILLSFFLISCSKSNSRDEMSSFKIDLTSSVSNATIDQPFKVIVSANQSMKSMWISYDNFATGGYATRDFGYNFTLNFNFGAIGTKIISVRCQNQNDEISEKQVVVNITRGTTVKITGLQVISFFGINTSYDPEYGLTDPNRLADLRFGFLKYRIDSSYDNTYNYGIWYLSPVIPNQGNMTWNFSNENLYIDPNVIFRFGLVDDDNGIGGADLLNGPPDYRELSFINYKATKPNQITYSFPEINLEVKLFVEWSN